MGQPLRTQTGLALFAARTIRSRYRLPAFFVPNAVRWATIGERQQKWEDRFHCAAQSKVFWTIRRVIMATVFLALLYPLSVLTPDPETKTADFFEVLPVTPSRQIDHEVNLKVTVHADVRAPRDPGRGTANKH